MQYKQKLPWCLISKLLKQHLGNIGSDGDQPPPAVYINRQKAKDVVDILIAINIPNARTLASVQK